MKEVYFRLSGKRNKPNNKARSVESTDELSPPKCYIYDWISQKNKNEEVEQHSSNLSLGEFEKLPEHLQKENIIFEAKKLIAEISLIHKKDPSVTFDKIFKNYSGTSERTTELGLKYVKYLRFFLRINPTTYANNFKDHLTNTKQSPTNLNFDDKHDLTMVMNLKLLSAGLSAEQKIKEEKNVEKAC